MRERAIPWTAQGPVYFIGSCEPRALFPQNSRHQHKNFERAPIKIEEENNTALDCGTQAET